MWKYTFGAKSEGRFLTNPFLLNHHACMSVAPSYLCARKRKKIIKWLVAQPLYGAARCPVGDDGVRLFQWPQRHNQSWTFLYRPVSGFWRKKQSTLACLYRKATWSSQHSTALSCVHVMSCRRQQRKYKQEQDKICSKSNAVRSSHKFQHKEFYLGEIKVSVKASHLEQYNACGWWKT